MLNELIHHYAIYVYELISFLIYLYSYCIVVSLFHNKLFNWLTSIILMIWMRKDEKMCKINICKLRNYPSYTLKRTDWTANIQNPLAKKTSKNKHGLYECLLWYLSSDADGLDEILWCYWHRNHAGQQLRPSVHHLHMWADSKTHFTVYDPNNNSSSLPCRVWITQSSSTWSPWQIVALFLNLVSCSTFYRDSVMEQVAHFELTIWAATQTDSILQLISIV